MSKLVTFRQTQLLESHVSGHMVKREVTAEGEVQHHQHHQQHQQHQQHQHHHIVITSTKIFLDALGFNQLLNFTQTGDPLPPSENGVWC